MALTAAKRSRSVEMIIKKMLMWPSDELETVRIAARRRRRKRKGRGKGRGERIGKKE